VGGGESDGGGPGEVLDGIKGYRKTTGKRGRGITTLFTESITKKKRNWILVG